MDTNCVRSQEHSGHLDYFAAILVIKLALGGLRWPDWWQVICFDFFRAAPRLFTLRFFLVSTKEAFR